MPSTRPSSFICPTRFRSFALTLSFLVIFPSTFLQAANDSLAEKFQFHGFLTQAYAEASYTDLGPTPDEIIVGISENGTTDYRFLALQFRYEISPDDLLVCQLSSRSLGESPINKIEDDIELDWAFYERRLADNTSVKVGRIQIPLGIFNEIRDVGTILPFFRPPYISYREGSFTSETVDGLLLHHTFFDETSWPVDADVYYGEYELIEQAVFVPEATPALATAEDVRGFQFWLNTPVSGLRLGLGGQNRTVTGGQEGIFRPEGGGSEFDDIYASVEYSGDKFLIRAELRQLDVIIDSTTFGFKSDVKNTIPWAQVGYYFTEKIHAFLQWETSEVEQSSLAFTHPVTQKDRTDFGIAVNYRFSSNVVLKAEYHEVEEEELVFMPVLANGIPLLDPVLIFSDGGNYSILSLAVSF